MVLAFEGRDRDAQEEGWPLQWVHAVDCPLFYPHRLVGKKAIRALADSHFYYSFEDGIDLGAFPVIVGCHFFSWPHPHDANAALGQLHMGEDLVVAKRLHPGSYLW